MKKYLSLYDIEKRRAESQRGIIKSRIPVEFCEQVLMKAGYIKLKNGSYVYNLFNKKRYHAYIKETGMEWHLDRTVNGMHKVSVWWKMIKFESKRLSKLYNQIRPPVSTEKRSKRWKGEFASNLIALQKGLKQNETNI